MSWKSQLCGRWHLDLVGCHHQDDFRAHTSLEAMIAFLREHGCPQRFSFDHDPRWVGGPGGWDFPSALLRFLAAVGVEAHELPPHTPQTGVVERYHRSYKQECLQVHQPQNLEEVKRITEAYQQHYNFQRPHQGRACGNRPPRQVFETLPTLPALPQPVDGSLAPRYHHRIFARLVMADGCVSVNREPYYLSTAMAGQKVALVVDEPSASFDVLVKATVLKWVPIKGVVRGEMPLERFITLMVEQARSEETLRLAAKLAGDSAVCGIPPRNACCSPGSASSAERTQQMLLLLGSVAVAFFQWQRFWPSFRFKKEPL